jgi:type IV secretory pathway TrbL component
MMDAMSGTDTRQPEPGRMGAARAVTVVCAAVSVLSAVALLVLVGGEAAGGAEGGCAPGVRQVNGAVATAFCGPAQSHAVQMGHGTASATGNATADRPREPADER